MNAQELQFELMKLASFNEFNGDKVVADLLANQKLWRGAVMDRAGYSRDGEQYGIISLIKLRDLPDYWNVDTLFIIPTKGEEDALEELANTWNADEVSWIGNEDASSKLGSWSKELNGNSKQILRIWWD